MQASRYCCQRELEAARLVQKEVAIGVQVGVEEHNWSELAELVAWQLQSEVVCRRWVGVGCLLRSGESEGLRNRVWYVEVVLLTPCKVSVWDYVMRGECALARR